MTFLFKKYALTTTFPNFKLNLFDILVPSIFRKLYINPQTGDLYKEGETIELPQLGQTLSTLAKEGPDAFYNGSLTSDIVQEFKDAGTYLSYLSGCIY